MIKGSDYVLNADCIFSPEKVSSSEVTATCVGATRTYVYDEFGKKTDEQKGWKYKVYIPARDLLISISIDGMICAVDTESTGCWQVKFTGFKATFYVDRNNHLALSVKADKAEKVVFDDELV